MSKILTASLLCLSLFTAGSASAATGAAQRITERLKALTKVKGNPMFGVSVRSIQAKNISVKGKMGRPRCCDQGQSLPFTVTGLKRSGTTLSGAGRFLTNSIAGPRVFVNPLFVARTSSAKK